jgi:peptide/nickel transport system permease protein
MGRFLLHRLLRTVAATWLILSAIFLLSRSLIQQQMVSRLSEGNASYHVASAQEQQQAEIQVRQRLGLTTPLFYLSAAPLPAQGLAWRWHWNGHQNQYHQWLRKLLRADLGASFRDGQPVSLLLRTSLGYTVPLTLGAALCSIGISWLLVAGLKPRSRWWSGLLTVLYGIDAVPLFVVSLLLLLLLANPDMLMLFPAYGLGRTEPADPWWLQLQTLSYHSALPLLILTLVSLPPLVVQLHSSLRFELGADYILTARAKGRAEVGVVRHHALRNALLPIIALLTDLLPNLIAGSVVVELVFSLPGMGRLLAEAAAARDYPVLLGGVLLIAVARILSQVLADWLYFQADPRIRLPL